MLVIGLTGYAGSGKSTLARELVTRSGFVPVSLAQYFKVPLCVSGAVPIMQAFGPDGKSPETRALLQRAGTEDGRDQFGEDHWVRHFLADRYRLQRAGVDSIVIDDIRFPNEAEWVRTLGGYVIRCAGRGGLTGAAALHPSEAQVDAITHDLAINTALLAPQGCWALLADWLEKEDDGVDIR